MHDPPFDPCQPDLQLGLTAIIPTGQIPTRFINRYRATSKVRCAFCDRHTEHNRGVTAEMADGRIALCGIDCATRHFGREVVRGLEAELARREAMHARRRQLENVLSGAQQVDDTIDRWLPLEHQIDGIVEDLREVLDGIQFRQKLTDSGTLRRVRIEPVQIEQQRPDGTTFHRPHERERIVGTVYGARLLVFGFGPLRKAQAALERIVRMSASSVDTLTDDHVTTALSLKSDVIAKLAEGIKRFEIAQRFLAEDNIKELHKWARSEWGSSPKIQWKKRASGPAILAKPPAEEEMWEMIVPDLSAIPTEEELISPLRSGNVATAAA